MPATYRDEQSNLRIWQVALQFPFCHLRNYAKRLFYSYFLRDFNIASINLVCAILLILFGAGFGTFQWMESVVTNQAATAGTVMLAALPLVLGWLSMLSFLTIDVFNIPTKPRQLQ